MSIENLTINYLHKQYQAGSLTPEGLVDYLLSEAEKYQHKNIWIHQLSREELQPYLDNLNIEDISNKPLWGIPFVIKDNIDLAGITTTAGCSAYAYEPEDHAHVVGQLVSAGAIPMGKANMDQLATGLVGVRAEEQWGVCKNSFDDDYISGGSSSGSGVSVALGLATFSLGTDTAGSGRVPAALNNIVGLKPSCGLLSCSGVVPACKSIDCVTIFATTTDDAAQVFEVAAHFDPTDPYGRKNPANNQKNYGQYQKPFVFAVPQAEQLQFFGDAQAQAVFEQSVSDLEKIGGTKVEVDCQPLFDAAKLLYAGPWVAERYVACESLFEKDPNTMLPVIQKIVGSQQDATAADTFKAQYQMQAYKQYAKGLFEQFDILVTPTAGTTYPWQDVVDNPIELNSNMGYYTNYVNLLDLSAIAVPAGFKDNGHPFGITLVGKAFEDTKLLSIANRWQSFLDLKLGATDWPLPQQAANPAGVMDTIDVVVCGAHLEGLPLNWQLTDRAAKLIEATTTTPSYRFYALAGGPPFRPGLIRDTEQGAAIDVEVWRVPASEFGTFVAGIPQPLGIGKVELADGRWLPSFICEPCGIEGAEEITHLGGWRAYMAQKG